LHILSDLFAGYLLRMLPDLFAGDSGNCCVCYQIDLLVMLRILPDLFAGDFAYFIRFICW
jgi:hypothetical protein